MHALQYFPIFACIIQTLMTIIINIITEKTAIITLNALNPLPFFILLIPHMIALKYNELTCLSAAALSIHVCYLLSQCFDLLGMKITKFISYFIKFEYSEPLQALLINILIEFIFLTLTKKMKKNKKYLIILNFLISSIIIYFVEGDVLLLIVFYVLKAMLIPFHLCRTNLCGQIFTIISVLSTYIIFYAIHYLIMISNIKIFGIMNC